MYVVFKFYSSKMILKDITNIGMLHYIKIKNPALNKKLIILMM